MGELESPSLLRLEFRTDPEKHIVLLGVSPQTRDEFYREISDRASRSRRKEILVFVHGYDNTFEDAARRTAQLAYDLGFDGAPILYSWPSAGNPLSYPADETSVEWSTPHLKAFLEDLAARSGATTIHLVAHSMGNRAVAGALNTPATARSDTTPLFKHVVLAAPDIDAGVFKQLATTLKKSADHVTLYASSRDEALLASHIFHQYARAGESGNQIVVVEGVDTIDATAVSTGLGLEHSYFADNKSILTDLYYLLRDNAAPDSRFGLRRRANLGYWVFQP
jgi:esterase/lipase superfamily enzyme